MVTGVFRSPPPPVHAFIFFAHMCGYQSLFPRLYRLLITIILQDHPGSSRQTLRGLLIVDPRACGCAHNPPWCISTPPSEKEKPAKGPPSHNWRRGSEARWELSNPTEECGLQRVHSAFPLFSLLCSSILMKRRATRY